jgi:hypothetical protein
VTFQREAGVVPTCAQATKPSADLHAMFYARTQDSMELCTAADRTRFGKAYISSFFVSSFLSVL